MKKIILLFAIIAISGFPVLAINNNTSAAALQIACDLEKTGSQFQLSFQARNGAMVKVFGSVDGFWGHGSAYVHIIMPDGTVIDEFVIFSGHTPDDTLAQLFEQYEGLEEAFWQAVDEAAGGN